MGKDKMMKAAVLATNVMQQRCLLWAFALLAMLAVPFAAHAQGIVGGAREGAYRGERAAGPIGGVVGGAIGAGVGGAVGGVKGVLGIPDRRAHRHYYRHRHYRHRH
jgi:hypothetical protein